MRDVRPWGTVPPSWHSAGIVDARAFTVGNSAVVHLISHAGPNRVRGLCGVVSSVIEADKRATWADAEVTCRTCLATLSR